MGAAPVCFVEVPGFVSTPALCEQEVARKVAELCGLTGPLERFLQLVLVLSEAVFVIEMKG